MVDSCITKGCAKGTCCRVTNGCPSIFLVRKRTIDTPRTSSGLLKVMTLGRLVNLNKKRSAIYRLQTVIRYSCNQSVDTKRLQEESIDSHINIDINLISEVLLSLYF